MAQGRERPGISCRANAAFTTVEIVVAVAILLVLGGIAVPVTAGVMAKAKRNATRNEMAGVARALHGWARDMGLRPAALASGRYPASVVAAGAYNRRLSLDLEQDLSGAGYDLVLRRGWSGPYIGGQDERTDADGNGSTDTVRNYQVDAWGRWYDYRNSAAAGTRTVTLTSGGPDRQLATAADNLVEEVYRGPDF